MKYQKLSKAKINLSLDIVSKRENGYHNLKMVMHSVDLADEMTFVEIPGSRLKLTSNLPYLPCDGRNIVHKAYEAFYEYTGIEKQGFDINIVKKVPVCAGLGGSSTNAATTLDFLNAYHHNPVDMETLMKIGEKLGADVPYCLTGGTCLAEGIGEILTPLKPLPKCHIVIAKPQNKGLSTKNIFSMVNINEIEYHPDTLGIIKALNEGDLNGICKRMYNVMECYSKKESPEIEKYKEILNDNGALGSVMSGSGNAVFGIFDDISTASDAVKKLKKKTSLVFLV